MSRSRRYHHVALGFNYRMTNMQAAVGVAQWERFDEVLALRRRQMTRYYEALDGVPGVALRQFAPWCTPVHWMTTISLAPRFERQAFLDFMQANDVDCRQMINPVHRAEHFRARFDDAQFPVATEVSARSAHLPSGTGLTGEQVDRVCSLVRAFVGAA